MFPIVSFFCNFVDYLYILSKARETEFLKTKMSESIDKVVEKNLGSKLKDRENVKGDTKKSKDSVSSEDSYVKAAIEYLKMRKNQHKCEFDTSTIEKYMRGRKLAKELKGEAAAYMSAVLNYLAAEVLELAGDAAAEEITTSKPAMIGPRHLKTAIGNDEELSKLLKEVSSSSSTTKTKKRVREDTSTTIISVQNDELKEVSSSSSTKTKKQKHVREDMSTTALSVQTDGHEQQRKRTKVSDDENNK